MSAPTASGTALPLVRAACPHDCPDTCAMLVTVEDGRAVEVRGDPDHPFTAGGLCVKVNNYVDRVYSEDRVLHPMRRTGSKGSGSFERITWDEALDEIATRYRDIIDEHGPEAIWPYSYLGTQGLLNGLTAGDPFFNRLGATVSERTFCDSGASTGYVMTVGPTAGMDPESFAHSRYIILWAANVQSTNLHLWPFIAKAKRAGAKVVVIDPVRTRTAQQADWHVPIRPGTDAALALGMLHVIITEDLVDHDYVERYTTGFDELAARVREYPPETVAEITGIPADDIRLLAREYATTSPSAIRIGVAIERQASGGQAVRAITSLPAVVGAWRKPGGGLLQLPLWAFPINWDRLHGSDLITSGTRVLNQWRIGPALTGELDLEVPVQALFVYNSNPVVVAPEQGKTLAGLARDDLFTVVHEQFLTDTARYADLVLPATTQLEQYDLMFSWGHLYLTLNQPAIEPLGEAISNVELFRRLNRRMGFEDGWYGLDDRAMARASMDWSHPNLEGITLEQLERDGWSRLSVPAPEDYAPHAEGAFPTPSGKVELVASMAAGGNFVLPVFRQGSNDHQPGEPVDPLPHHRAPATDGGDHPLSLLSPKSHAFLNSTYSDQPHQRRVQGEQRALIHPEDAAARDIVDGQRIEVHNDRGRVQAVAALTEDVARGVVVCSMGHWRTTASSNGGGEVSTVNAITTPAYADLGNAPTFSDTRVEVSASVPASPV
jgi:anaerobic selenocysteine-containing dehydrogenase